MKFLAKLLLILFVTFLATPTIVSLIEKSSNTTFFFSMSEEEQPHKEFKADIKNAYDCVLIFFPKKPSTVFLTIDSVDHHNLTSSIFIPPPELT